VNADPISTTGIRPVTDRDAATTHPKPDKPGRAPRIHTPEDHEDVDPRLNIQPSQRSGRDGPGPPARSAIGCVGSEI